MKRECDLTILLFLRKIFWSSCKTYIQTPHWLVLKSYRRMCTIVISDAFSKQLKTCIRTVKQVQYFHFHYFIKLVDNSNFWFGLISTKIFIICSSSMVNLNSEMNTGFLVSVGLVYVHRWRTKSHSKILESLVKAIKRRSSLTTWSAISNKKLSFTSCSKYNNSDCTFIQSEAQVVFILKYSWYFVSDEVLIYHKISLV